MSVGGSLGWNSEVVNTPLRKGVVTSAWKQLYQVQKMPRMDTGDNYWPIANFLFLSNVIELMVAGQLQDFLDEAHGLDPFQSSFMIA